MRLKSVLDQISAISIDHIKLNTGKVLSYSEILAVEDIEALAVVNKTVMEI
jgi:hypothetical protein